MTTSSQESPILPTTVASSEVPSEPKPQLNSKYLIPKGNEQYELAVLTVIQDLERISWKVGENDKHIDEDWKQFKEQISKELKQMVVTQLVEIRRQCNQSKGAKALREVEKLKKLIESKFEVENK